MVLTRLFHLGSMEPTEKMLHFMKERSCHYCSTPLTTVLWLKVKWTPDDAEKWLHISSDTRHPLFRTQHVLIGAKVVQHPDDWSCIPLVTECPMVMANALHDALSARQPEVMLPKSCVSNNDESSDYDSDSDWNEPLRYLAVQRAHRTVPMPPTTPTHV